MPKTRSHEQPRPRTDSRGVLRAVRLHLDDLRNSEKKVALVVLESPTRSFISPSANWRSMPAPASPPSFVSAALWISVATRTSKIQLAQDLVPEVKNIHEDVTPDDDAATLIRRVLNTNALAISNTLDTLDPAATEKAIHALARADADRVHRLRRLRRGGHGCPAQILPPGDSVHLAG